MSLKNLLQEHKINEPNKTNLEDITCQARFNHLEPLSQ